MGGAIFPLSVSNSWSRFGVAWRSLSVLAFSLSSSVWIRGLCCWISPALISLPSVYVAIDPIAFRIANSIMCMSGPWILKGTSLVRLIPVNG